MNPVWGNIIGVFTTLTMLTFIGIWIWAWRRKHKKLFNRMSRLPMEDTDATNEVPTEKEP